jgi:hypothetical protein
MTFRELDITAPAGLKTAVETNAEDMVKLEERHKSGGTFTYTVMNLDQTEQGWSFEAPLVLTNEQFDQQVEMIDRTDLQRRFEVKLPDNPGNYLAYA